MYKSLLKKLRIRYNWFHHSHRGKHLKKVGSAGVVAEGGYHACELCGAHTPLLICAAILLSCLVVKVITEGFVE